jgi:protein-tyrosine phosphatase
MPRHPDRLHPLQGTSNFRDFGGYAGHEGRRVRWGVLFRSDHLADLSAQDHRQLQAIGLRRAFDLRGEQERAARSYSVPGVRQHALCIEPTLVQRADQILAAHETMTPELMGDLMRGLYRRLINEQAHRFAELFAHLLAEDTPLVIHCTAGKDRTGVAAALILLALGVSREAVEHDYLLSNEHFRPPPQATSQLQPEVLAVLWRVRADFLAEAFEAIERDQGGLETYLGRRLGLDLARRAALRERYLQSD